eukprot:m51a1_g7234 putative C-tail anchored protein (1223) ;mRNA; r:64005-67673
MLMHRFLALLLCCSVALNANCRSSDTTWPGYQSLADVAASGIGYMLHSNAVYDASVSAAAGDVDGDGVGDVVTAGHGAVHVVLGPLSQRTRLATSPGHRIDAPQCAGGAASVAVASAGDIDGDGLGDVVAVCGGGRAYVVLGRVRGAAAAWPRDTYSVGNATRSFAVAGAGAWAAGVGDVNGDKCGDMAVARSDGQVAVLLGRRGAAWPDVVDVSAAPSLFPFGGFVVRDAERMGGAGDVNGDGVGDLVVGSALLSPGGRYRAGSAFVVFGRASFGETLDLSRDSGVVAVEGERDSDMAGMSVSGAGDLDADGAPDVVVGLPSRAKENYARYFVVFGSRNSSAAWPRSLVVGTAPQAASGVRTCLVYANALGYTYDYDKYGAVLSSSAAGDVNGDGVGDVVLCHTVPSVASKCTALLGAAGQWPSTLVADSVQTSLGVRSVVMYVPTSSLLLGRSVGALGDIDGNGMDDILMGAPKDDNSSTGCTYILRGHKWNASTLPSKIELDLAEHQGTGYILRSQTTAPQVGASVHGVGDINNDGRADFAVGAPGAGRVFLRFGAVGPVEPESSIEAGSVVLESSETWDMFGWSVSSAGDINGDGVADLVVGAPGADSGVGRAYVVFGRSGFWAPGAVVDVANLSLDEGIAISGDKAWPGCGRQVSSAGDMNKDGVDDIIVGAVRTTGIRNAIAGGRMYVVLGSKQLGNVNVSGLDGRNGFSVDNAVQSGSPSFVLAGVGDVNGDGVNDAAFGSSAPVEESGWAVHVLFGKNGQWGPSVDVRSLDGINGFTVTSNQTDSWLFPTLTVGSAGDINNDSMADIVLGTFLGSYILFGRGGRWPSILTDADVAAAGVTLPLGHTGPVTSLDVNADGISDIAHLSRDAPHYVEVVFGRVGQWPSEIQFYDLFKGVGGFLLVDTRGTITTGHSSLSHADANGDMVDDLLIGTPDVNGGSGSAMVFYGSHEPRVATPISQLPGFHNATQGAEYSFTVPADVAFWQADGKKLTLSASAVGYFPWDWLGFHVQTNTFYGTPNMSWSIPSCEQIAVTASNNRGVRISQQFSLCVVSSISIDLGANLPVVWYGGEKDSVTRLAPITVSTTSQTVTVEIMSAAKDMYSKETSTEATVRTGAVTWTAEGTVAGVNKLLSYFVFQHFSVSDYVDFTVWATDGFGGTCQARFRAERNAKDKDDLFGIELDIVWIAIAVCAGVGLICAAVTAVTAVVCLKRRQA